jgi:hypothetical protein
MGDRVRRELEWGSPALMGAALDEQFETHRLALEMGELFARLEADPGGGGRAMILAPPRSTKSTTVAEWGALYWLARRPWQRVLVATYSRPAARLRGSRLRGLVKNYGRDLGLRVAPHTPDLLSWELTGGGGLTCCAPRDDPPGCYDLLVVDDPHRSLPETVDVRRRLQVVDWCRWLIARRLNPGAGVAVVMRRWHPADLAGVLLSDEGEAPGGAWRVLNADTGR